MKLVIEFKNGKAVTELKEAETIEDSIHLFKTLQFLEKEIRNSSIKCIQRSCDCSYAMAQQAFSEMCNDIEIS